MRKYLVAAGAAAVMAIPGIAAAQGGEPGFYVGVRGGANWLQDAPIKSNNTNLIQNGNASFDFGYVGAGVAGYDFGGLRLEVEGGYRHNGADRVRVTRPAGSTSLNGVASGNANAWYGTANVLYGFDTGTAFRPYLGVGAGVAGVNHKISQGGTAVVDDSDTQFAYQGIVGVGYHFDANWAVSADYRYFATLDPSFRSKATVGGASYESEYRSHSIMLGVTYKFVEPKVAAVAPPIVAPKQKSFLVFFDFDRADITARSAQTINEAADEYLKGGYARIVLTGHTDRSGSPQYNQRLSLRRAEAVRSVLAKRGISGGAVTVIGKGEGSPLVPTADGVREPQNRRVEIDLG